MYANVFFFLFLRKICTLSICYFFLLFTCTVAQTILYMYFFIINVLTRLLCSHVVFIHVVYLHVVFKLRGGIVLSLCILIPVSILFMLLYVTHSFTVSFVMTIKACLYIIFPIQ
jgi:hypothetical protein